MVLDGEGVGNENQDEETDEDETDRAVKAQDFHTILSAILESFVQLQETGFIWDLVHKGKIYKGIEFVIFVPFVKCDTEEADLLCGKCLVRGRHVAHVCRCCHCPTDKADDPRANYRLKTQPEIAKMVQKGQLEKLQSISQQCIENAWHNVLFHLANECGIHGACPSEKLHAVQLGLFKHVRDMFFDRVGPTSILANDLNGLRYTYNNLASAKHGLGNYEEADESFKQVLESVTDFGILL